VGTLTGMEQRSMWCAISQRMTGMNSIRNIQRKKSYSEEEN